MRRIVLSLSLDKHQNPGNAFSTFRGVFIPCILTIFGAIMHLRLSLVVGRMGIVQSIVIILAAASISFITSLSLSAIATNTRVKGGGPYFLVSRTLGAQFGATLGIVFYCAQAIAVALYIVGFSEAFVRAFGLSSHQLVLVATVVNALLFISVFIGAKWTMHVQYLFLVLVVLSLISFFWGALTLWDNSQLQNNLAAVTSDYRHFIVMFALFFPAISGMTAGANLSGDLKNPSRAIPLGTLSAVILTTLVYLAMAVSLAASCPRDVLLENNFAVSYAARSEILITLGIFGATLSSAVGCMMGAPRILQALARDRLFAPLQIFAKGSSSTDEPRNAILMTFVLSQAGIMLGDLNVIAPIITMAFLITYGTLNMATFYESVTGNPSYRPKFRYCHWSISLVGALACLIVMFLIAPVQAFVALVVMISLYRYISYRKIEGRWGSLQSGVLFERVRKNLVQLEETAHHPKNWRPIILALSGGGWERPHIALYGHWFAAGNGILSLGQIITGDITDRSGRRDSQEELLRQFISKQELQAFPAVVVAPDITAGIQSLVQCHGIGLLRPNTILTGWPSDYQKAASFFATIRNIIQLRRNVICMRLADYPADPREVPEGTIDVWWRGKDNGPLMLLLAYLLSLNLNWRDHTVRLMRIISNQAGEEQVYSHLQELIQASRIPATPHVIVAEDSAQAIISTSADAALVILGFDLPDAKEEEQFYEHMEELTGSLSRCAFVYSAGGMDLYA